MDIKGLTKVFDFQFSSSASIPGYCLTADDTLGNVSWSYPTVRLTSVASSATPTPDLDTTDIYELTALAESATFGVPTGSLFTGRKLTIRIKDDGNVRNLAWNAVYRESLGIALPTITSVGNTLTCNFVYDNTASKWDLISGIFPTFVAILGNDHSISGNTVDFTAGSDFAFGDVGYISSNGNIIIANATAISTSSGFVLAGGTVSSGSSGLFLLVGITRNDSWNWTPGGLVYLSASGSTGNTLTQTAPTDTDSVTQVIGVATHADRIFFNPSLVQVEHK
jgi:hypothetical protein